MPVEINLPIDPIKIEKTIHYWLDLLAKEDYAEAYHLTAHNPYYNWTPEMIEDYINGYGLPYEKGNTVYKVTDWREMGIGKRNPMDISLFDNHKTVDKEMFKRVGIVHYDIPLNGERSDLTVIFGILQADKYFTLELNDIHVL